MHAGDIHTLMQNTHVNCQQMCIVLVFSVKTNTTQMCWHSTYMPIRHMSIVNTFVLCLSFLKIQAQYTFVDSWFRGADQTYAKLGPISWAKGNSAMTAVDYRIPTWWGILVCLWISTAHRWQSLQDSRASTKMEFCHDCSRYSYTYMMRHFSAGILVSENKYNCQYA